MDDFQEDLSSSESDQDNSLFSPFREQQEEPFLLTEQFDITKWSQQALAKRPEKPKPKSKKLKTQQNAYQTKSMKSSSISPQKKKRSSKIKHKMKDIKPLNLELEKVSFFMQKGAYNPQFSYNDSQFELAQEKPHRKYEDIALKILDTCIKEFGSESNYMEIDGGRILSLEETEQYFINYIAKHNVSELISYEFQENTIAPTSVVHNPIDGKSKVIIGLPINYRINRIEGVLNHEIGTHFIRKINDRQQTWYKRRLKFHLDPYLKHEEGLAVINQTLPSALRTKGKPYLYMAALHYISSILSSQMSFAELYHQLRYFIQDDNKRFRECLRVKRGMRDTSQPGGMYKDQVYLKGSIKILRSRKQLNFINFHCGKITVKDCIRLSETNQINCKNMYLPMFLADLELYKKGLDILANFNYLV